MTDEDLKAPAIKRWMKTHLKMNVRVQTGSGKAEWLTVWIPSSRLPEHRHKLVYTDPLFPAWFGNLCMREVYKGHKTLESQNWGGNVRSHSIAMRRSEWVNVMTKCEGLELGTLPKLEIPMGDAVNAG